MDSPSKDQLSLLGVFVVLIRNPKRIPSEVQQTSESSSPQGITHNHYRQCSEHVVKQTNQNRSIALILADIYL